MVASGGRYGIKHHGALLLCFGRQVDFEADAEFEKELQADLVAELQAKVRAASVLVCLLFTLTGLFGFLLSHQVGEPEKITLFAKNPLGVIVVKFKTAFAAAE